MKVDSIIESIRKLQNDLITTQFALNDLVKVLERFNKSRNNTETVIKISDDSKMIEIPLSKKTGKAVRAGCPRSEDSEYSPTRQAVGSVNGAKAAGIPKTKTVRRQRGTVNVKNMTPPEKREYWRWANRRRTERMSGEILEK